jgi:hypothetical protein
LHFYWLPAPGYWLLKHMSFIRQLIEKKISSATGAAVTFGGFKFSPMSGTIEARNVKIAAERFVPPFLSIDRLEAQVPVARALRGEINLRSLIVERPVLTLNVHPDGTTNLPAKRRGKVEAIVRKEGSAGGSWEFDTERISITDGRFELRSFTHHDYRVSIEGINASVTPEGKDLAISLTADSFGRRDREIEVGGIKLLGRLIGGGFHDPLASALTSRASVADAIVVEITSTLIANKCFDIEIAGATKLMTLVGLLPGMSMQNWALDGEGTVGVRAKLAADLFKHVRVNNVELKTGAFSIDRTFGSVARTESPESPAASAAVS